MVNFFKRLFSKPTQLIGVELAPEKINIVQVRQQGQKVKLLTLASTEVPEGIFQESLIYDVPGLAELLKTTLEENKIKIKQAAAAIPGREAVIRVIPVPAELNDIELRDYMNQEAGLYLPFPREEADVDYQRLGLVVDEDGIEKVQVLLVATRKEITDNYINTFAQAGLQLKVLEVSSFALIRTIKNQLQQFAPQEAVVLVDIEFETTEIAIVVEGVPQFSRTVPIGTFQIQSALSKAMNLPPTRNTDLLQGMTIPVAQGDSMQTGITGGMAGTNPGVAAMLRVLGELADELRRSIDFYLNQSDNLEVAQLLLAGPGGALGQLDDYFTQRLSFPTTRIDPIEALGLEFEQEIPEIDRPGLGVALGLGLREL